MNQASWIVAANSGRARIFMQTGRNAPLEEIDDLINNGARLRTAETESDTLGQFAASKSGHSTGQATQPNGYEPEQSPQEHQTELFARNVAGILLKARNDGRYGQLCLVAAPEFLGVLRKVMNAGLQSLVTAEINKDYTQLTPADLCARLKELQFGR